MTPQDFITKWGPGGPAFHLNEEQGAQSHFMDLCDLLDVPKPGSQDGYLFEEKSAIIGGSTGYADVFKRGVFAWENKAPGRSLDTALKQLLTYSLALSNPPLLVVCDRLTLRIHTQFTGHPTEVHTVLLADFDRPESIALLRRIWLDPESFRPKKTSRDITEAAAKNFATLADQLRKAGHEPQKVSHFLTQCLFCFFAEDVGLLPDRMFEKLISFKLDAHTPYGQKLPTELVTEGLSSLFNTMRTGGLFGFTQLIYFNGGLFEKVDVPKLSIINVTELRKATTLNWSAIDVSIFGTLFERGLDPAKRSQLGAHYTDPATIQRIIEPVMQRPLLQQWELLVPELIGLLAKSKRRYDAHYKLANDKFSDWLLQLRNYRVLDPACGSGNFLFLGLKTLKDIEHKSHLDAAAMGLDRQADLVTGPHNMLGIELNEYAAELARVTVWIGELQWRLTHGYEFKKNPVLEPLDNIECRDALLTFVPDDAGAGVSDVVGDGESAGVSDGESAGRAAGQRPAAHTLRFLKSPPASAPLPDQLVNGSSNLGSDPSLKDAGSDPNLRVSLTKAVEATWPKASIVIGNPPFLGDKKMRSELGGDYTEALRHTYKGRVPGGADLVCYWFEKARKAIEINGLGAAGLVATNSIRGGKNRFVLDAIENTTRIYEAWSDEGWVNDGAAVRVSLVAFGHATQVARLDGNSLNAINTDLTIDLGGSASLDLTDASQLADNKNSCFVGTSKKASFDIAGELARSWMKKPNPHGLNNSHVVKPWINGSDLVRAASDTWIVDFGVSRTESEAALFELPFGYVHRFVKPEKDRVRNDAERRKWWLHARTAPDMRVAIKPIKRFMATSIVAKYRLWVWRPAVVLASHAVCIASRSDDTTFGILHSRFHELWSLRMCTWLGVGNDPRYTPTTCFETFPFPAGLTPHDTASQQTETLPDGSVIPAFFSDQANQAMVGLVSGATSKRPKAVERPVPTPPAPGLVDVATAIASAAKHLNDLRENWLNPPEWTDRIPEVTPLGMATSPYPDRIIAKPGHEKDLAERTLTKLYNQRPAWLIAAHKQLDAAVAAAYNWADYTADMPDEEILKRLLALNLERAA